MDLVFATTDGGPILPANLLRSFRRIVQRAGVPPITFHALRHTHATLLLKEGTHAKIVSERLGHANIGITLDTYSHVLPGMQREAAESIDRALFGTSNINRTG
jgi:integrase